MAVRLLGVSRIASVNLAVPEPNPAKDAGLTGINKRPVDHLVTVRAPGPKTTGLHSGLVGDQVTWLTAGLALLAALAAAALH